VLSDGTLRLLALFLLLRSASPGALVAIEEPENGVHPGSLRALIEELVDATTPRGAVPPQVLVNSHSPALVAALHHRPEALVFADLVRRADGLHATRMRHVWKEGDPRDRGATSVSMAEVQRLLDTARPVDEVA
jgi:predicted ATPase